MGQIIMMAWELTELCQISLSYWSSITYCSNTKWYGPYVVVLVYRMPQFKHTIHWGSQEVSQWLPLDFICPWFDGQSNGCWLEVDYIHTKLKCTFQIYHSHDMDISWPQYKECYSDLAPSQVKLVPTNLKLFLMRLMYSQCQLQNKSLNANK